MIVKYTNKAAYDAAGKPTTESRVALIDSTNDIKVDGINIITENPVCGDAIYHDGTKVVFFKGGDQLNHSLLASQGFTKVGAVIGKVGNKTLGIHVNDQGNQKWCDCVQHEITAVSSTNITIKLAMAGNYATPVSIPVTLTSAEINATSASEIAAAIEAAGNTDNVGYDKHKWWAFYDEDNSRIIVQNDASAAWQQYNSIGGTGSNITTALCVYGDMPVNGTLFRKSGYSASYGGMSYSKFYSYYSVSGKTPTSNIPLNSNDVVTKDAFENSQYCAALRQAYGTYDNYISNSMVMFPQKYGCFNLPDGKTMTYTYGDDTFTKKDGTISWKYPAMHTAKTVGFSDIPKIDVGDWYLPGVSEGMMFMPDDKRDIISATIGKMGGSQITNSVVRWLSHRYGSNVAWLFSGPGGSLSYSYVGSSSRVQAVVLL